MPGIDETSKSFRVRQKNPTEFKEGSFRTIEITKGVKAVIGIPKNKSDVAYEGETKQNKSYINVFRSVNKVENAFYKDLVDILDSVMTNIVVAIKKKRKIIKPNDAYTEEELFTALNQYKEIINSEMDLIEKQGIPIAKTQVKESALATILGIGDILGTSKVLKSETDKQLLSLFQSAAEDSIVGLRSDIQKSVIKQVETDFLNGESERSIVSNIRKYFKNTQINVPEKVVNGQVVRQAYTRTMTAKNRAQIIVRDLSKNVYNQFSEQRYKEAGVQKFEYLTARDDRVRPTHAAMEGQVYTINSPMYRNARTLLGEINCRCVQIPITN